jgi:hypothetical protein
MNEPVFSVTELMSIPAWPGHARLETTNRYAETRSGHLGCVLRRLVRIRLELATRDIVGVLLDV